MAFLIKANVLTAPNRPIRRRPTCPAGVSVARRWYDGGHDDREQHARRSIDIVCRFSPLGLRGINHLPEGGNRGNAVEHWNGKWPDNRRNICPTPLTTPPLVRKITNKRNRPHEHQ